MKVGISLNYARHDFTYAALKTAEVLENLGYDVTIYNRLEPTTRIALHDYWDEFVKSSKQVSFETWSASVDRLIFFSYSDAQEIKAIKKRGTPVTCVATWDSVDADIVSSLKQGTTVVTPSAQQAKYFQSYWRLKNVVHIPWDCNWAFSQIDRTDSEPLKVLVACPGFQIKRVDVTKLYETLIAALDDNPGIKITFLFSNKVAKLSKNQLKALTVSKENGSSIIAIDDPTGWFETPLIYGEHDITVYPGQIESFGSVVLESLTMGTPVVCYDFPPMNEIVSNSINGFLLECGSSSTDLGVSYALHSDSSIRKTLSFVFNNKSILNKMRASTSVGLEARRKQFSALWAEVIDAQLSK